MKRRLFLAIVLVCFVSLVLGIFVACNNNTEKQQGGSDATYYTVTFDSQGGSPVDSQRIESGKTATQPSDPTKADADFDAWYTDAACTAGNEYDFSSLVTADIVLYAKWIPRHVYAQFDSDGGYPIVPLETYDFGEEISAPSDPSREGYSFGGWYTDAQLTNEARFPYKLEANTNFYAKWTAEGQTTVRYLLAEPYGSSLPVNYGGEVMQSTTVNKGSLLEQPDNPPDITYLDADSIRHTLKFAFWNAQYSYNLENQGINSYHEAVLFPVDVKERDELTLYAVYIEVAADDTYASLTVHPGNGAGNTVMYGIMGQSVGVALTTRMDFPFCSVGYNQPYREGYICTGYYKSADFSVENIYEVPFVLTSESNHVYLRWEKQPDITVVFKKGFNNEILSQQSVEYNGKIVRPENAFVAGYTFDGWFWRTITSVDDYRWNFDFSTNISATRELTPKWVKSAKVVTYEVNGGTPIQPLSHSEGRVLYEFPVAQRYDEEGNTYNFLGWYLDADCTVPVEIPYTLQSDVTFYAKWSNAIDYDNFVFTYYPANDCYSVSVNPAVMSTITSAYLPTMYAGKEVRRIEASGFENCFELESIYLNDNIKRIGNNAFANCSSLVKVELPDEIEEIGFDAFKNCPSLGEVNCPSSLVYAYSNIFSDAPLMKAQLEEIEGLYYWGNVLLGTAESLEDYYVSTDNEEITAVNIKQGTETVVFGALRALAGVESIVFPEGVEYINSCVLPLDNGVLKSVSYPSTVKIIKIINFGYDNNDYYDFPLTLENITVAADNADYRVENGCLVEIDTATLLGALKTATAVPEGVRIIAQNSMRGNVNATVTIPSSTTTIMASAFYGGAMTSMVIPDNVGALAENAFGNCENMVSLSLGKKVNLLTSAFFADMDDLAALSCSDENPNMFSQTNVLYNKVDNEVIAVARYMEGELRILDGTTAVSSKMFGGARLSFPNVTSVVIPDSVVDGGSLGYELISNNVFGSKLSHIEIGAGVPASEFRALCTLSGVTDVVISPDNPNVVMSNGLVLSADGATIVGNLSGVEEVIIPDSVTSVLEDLYWGGTVLGLPNATSLHIGSGMTRDEVTKTLLGISYGMDFISGTTEVLACVTVSDGNPYLSARDGLLYSKDYSELIYVPEKLNVENLVLPAQITALDTPIGQLSRYVKFMNGTKWEYKYMLDASVGYLSVEEGSQLQRIGNEVLRSTEGSVQGAHFDIGVLDLSNATQLVSLGDYAIAYQTHLSEVILPDSVRTIGTEAFVFDTALTTLNMPANIVSIGTNAFTGTLLLDDEDNLIIDGVLYVAEVSEEGETYVVPDNVTRIFKSAITWPRTNSVIIPDTVQVVDSQAIVAANYLIVYCELDKRPDGYAEDMCEGEAIVIYGYPDNSVGEDGKIYISENGALYCYDSETLTVTIEDVNNALPETFAPSATYELNGKTYSLVAINNRNLINDANSKLSTVVVPEGVTSIGAKAFSRYTMLSSVILPSTLKTIGDEAFAYSGEIQNIVIPSSVESVGVGAFHSSGVQSVTWNSAAEIPERCFMGSKLANITVTGNIERINGNAFANCQLTEITLPESLAEIAGDAFSSSLQRIVFKGGNNLAIPADMFGGSSSQQSALTYVELGEGIVSIGEAAFKYCTSLTGKLVLPDSLETIGDEAFAYTGITAIDFGTDITNIGAAAFMNCSSMEGDLVMPDLLETIGDKAFIQTGYASVKFGAALKTIGNSAFENVPLSEGADFSACAKLTSIGNYAFGYSELVSVTLPDSLNTLGEYAFYGCAALTDVEFGTGLQTIGNYAFGNCTALEKTVYKGTALQTIQERAFYGCTSLVSTEPDYVTGSGATTIYELPEGLQYIGSTAFYNAGITEVTIPSTVEKMVYLPFWNCTSLTKVNYNASNALHLNKNEDGNYSNTPFYKCTEISNVVIGSTVKTLPSYLFYNMTKLKEISLPTEGKLLIGNYAFRECTALEEIILTDAVTGVSTGAFYKCSALEKVYISASVTLIAQYAFSGTKAFTTVDQVQYIGEWAIDVEDGATEVVLREGTVGIAEYAFAESDVESIEIGEGVKHINKFAFWKAPLTTVTLPSSLETVGTGIFYGCAQLVTINVPFAEGELPKGWDDSWNNKCSATIVYKQQISM